MSTFFKPDSESNPESTLLTAHVHSIIRYSFTLPACAKNPRMEAANNALQSYLTGFIPRILVLYVQFEISRVFTLKLKIAPHVSGTDVGANFRKLARLHITHLALVVLVSFISAPSK